MKDKLIMICVAIFLGVGCFGGWLYLTNEPAGAFITSEQWTSTQYYEDGDTVWGAVMEAYFRSHDVAHVESFASIFASSTTVVINTTDTDTVASSGWELNETSGPSYNGTTGIFTIQSGGGGRYMAGFSVSMTGQANATVHYHLFRNGSEVSALSTERKLSGNDVGNMAISNIVDCAVGDTIKLMTSQNTGTTNQTLNHGSFWINRTVNQ